ncbi:MAG: hypothetical protein J0G99_09975 [Alphaproteobacteria bacterium]|nr:hypothetical protein [Alphaproteobacteria bacterium]
MLAKHELMALACKMIDTLGEGAADKMDVVVAAHVEDGDAEGAEFWGAVADTVRRVETAAAAALAPRKAS